MTVTAETTYFLEGGVSYDAQDMREFLNILRQGTTGIIGEDSLEVTPSSPASLRLQIAGGHVLVPSTIPASEDHYLATFRSGEVQIQAAHATQHRIDLIVARAYDTTRGSVTLNEVRVEAVRGQDTAAGSTASPPDLPDASIPLAEVRVLASAAALDAAAITDRRSQGTQPVVSSSGMIDSTELVNGAVTEEKLAALSVSTGKLQDEAVTNAKVMAASLNGDRLINGTIFGGKIASQTITGNNILNNTITGPKLANGTVNGSKILNAVYRVQVQSGGSYTQQESNNGSEHRAVYVGSTQPPGSNYQVGDIWLEV